LVPKGKPLLTLKDAAESVAALPAKTSTQKSWPFAMQILTDADRGGIVTLARIAMLRASQIQPSGHDARLQSLTGSSNE
jgi:hypothetical protein